jgi:hypothetical protein
MPATLPVADPTNSTYTPGLATSLQAMNGQGDAILTFPVSFASTDAQVLYTVPVGIRLQMGRAFWEVVTPFTGGASSAIGVSSSNANASTKGDLLGGATGDVAANLTAGFKGTVGTRVASSGLVVLVAGDTIRFDRITSAFTAGAGNLHIPVQLVPTS